MEGGGFVAGAVFASLVVVVVVVVVAGGAVGKGATDDAGLGGLGARGLTPGAVVVCGLEDGGATEELGETDDCPAAKLIAASDSATTQRGRSTRYV